jgi:Zn finger protein HypA/HybF involved in hydrogenase expression
MHGIHIAAELVKKAKEQGKVKKAYIEVGEIANITKNDLENHLKNIADFKFTIDEKKARVRCACGYVGSPKILERQHDIVLFSCQKCGLNPEAIEGDKVILKKVEVE